MEMGPCEVGAERIQKAENKMGVGSTVVLFHAVNHDDWLEMVPGNL
jgi:hypothetical protein